MRIDMQNKSITVIKIEPLMSVIVARKSQGALTYV